MQISDLPGASPYVPVAPLTTVAEDAPRPANPTPIPQGRPRELVALVGIVALADVSLYRGVGGAGLAALFVGVPALSVVAASVRRVSSRFAVVLVLVLLVAARCLWMASPGAAVLGTFLLLAFAIGLRMAETFLPELMVSSLGSAL